VDERKTDMSATPSDERREYRHGTRTFVLLLVPSSVLLLLGVCFGVPGWLAHDIALRNFGLFFMIMWLGLTAYLAFLAWNARLTLAPDGIEVRGAVGIGPVLIRWDNIARLRVKPRHQGLVLLAPMKTPAADRLWDYARIYSTYDREELGLIAQRRYVPLADYSPRFRQGNLQHEILRRAPWLAGDVGLGIANGQKPTLGGERRFRNALSALEMCTPANPPERECPFRRLVQIVARAGSTEHCMEESTSGGPCARDTSLWVSLSMQCSARTRFPLRITRPQRQKPCLVWGQSGVFQGKQASGTERWTHRHVLERADNASSDPNDARS